MFQLHSLRFDENKNQSLYDNCNYHPLITSLCDSKKSPKANNFGKKHKLYAYIIKRPMWRNNDNIYNNSTNNAFFSK